MLVATVPVLFRATFLRGTVAVSFAHFAVLFIVNGFFFYVVTPIQNAIFIIICLSYECMPYIHSLPIVHCMGNRKVKTLRVQDLKNKQKSST